MAVAPPAVVDGPAVETLRYGLFSVAAMPEETSNRWQNGVVWETLAPCESAEGYGGDDCDSPGPIGLPLTIREGQAEVEATPFQINGSYRCKTFSKPLDEARARAMQHLLAWEERGVENAIMRGHLGNDPSFQGAVDLTGGTATTPANALNLLEGWLVENTPGIGVLHAPRGLTGSLSSDLNLSRQGGHIETLVGTRVAFGGGYDTNHVGPGGTAPAENEFWVYATARPVIRRSEVFFTPGENNLVNPSDNDVTIVAHRTYVVGWDCTVAAALVSTPLVGSP